MVPAMHPKVPPTPSSPEAIMTECPFNPSFMNLRVPVSTCEESLGELDLLIALSLLIKCRHIPFITAIADGNYIRR